MQKSTLIVGIILCVLVAALQPSLQSSLTKALLNLSSDFKIVEFCYALSMYILIPLLFKAFKSKAQMLALLLCWVSCDLYFYLNISNSFILFYSEIISFLNINALLSHYNISPFIVNHGSAVYIGYTTFYLITLTFIALQEKHNVFTLLTFGIMCSFQLFMAADFIYAPTETFLSKNYHYILTGIHLLIISTMVRWTIIARIRANIKYGILAIRCRLGHYLGS